jgi:Fur family transcriptional regulator, ferric uptake regulator
MKIIIPGGCSGGPVEMPKASKYEGVVLRVLDGSARFRSCQEVHQALADSCPAGSRTPSVSTVYRTLYRLVESGALDTVQSPAGERLFRRCRATDRHHHLFCRNCGRVEDIAQIAELASVAERIRRASGFAALDYSFELTGLCPRCC